MRFRFRLGSKLMVAFAVVALLVGAVGGFVMAQTGKVVEQYDNEVIRLDRNLAGLHAIDAMLHKQVADLNGYVLMHDTAYLNDYRDGDGLLNAALADVLAATTDAEVQAKLHRMQVMQEDQATAFDKVARLVEGQQDAIAVQVLRNEVAPLTNQASDLVEALVQTYADAADRGQDEAQAMARTAQQSGVIAMAAGLMIALIMGAIMARNISRPVLRIAAAAAKVAEGDLRVDAFKVRSRDEVGQLAQSFAQMVEQLQSLIAGVASSVQQVSAAAGSLSESSGQTAQASNQTAGAVGSLAAGAGAQAEKTESVSKIMEQLQQAIDQVATSASRTSQDVQEAVTTLTSIVHEVENLRTNAAELAKSGQQAADIARAGAAVVGETVKGMGRIKDASANTAVRVQELDQRSRQIGEIIEVISGIAAQTNLLALNAAIEAARAGEHGKGFAVVAEEVRQLAELSGKSAKQIGDLVAAIQTGTAEAVKAMTEGNSAVTTGHQMTQEAGKALADILRVAERIAGDVEQVAQAVGHVEDGSRSVAGTFDAIAAAMEENSAAAEEMAASADQAAEALAGISSIAHENAAVAQEVSASTEELTATAASVADSASTLHEIAASLLAETSRFKV